MPKVEEAVFLQDSTVLKCLFQALCQGLGDTRPIPSGRHDPPTLGLLQLEVEMGTCRRQREKNRWTDHGQACLRKTRLAWHELGVGSGAW